MRKTGIVLLILGLALVFTSIGPALAAQNGVAQATCPSGGGWVKIDSDDLSSYPVAGATDYCFKAGSNNSQGCEGGLFGSIPEGGFGNNGICGLSHWSYFMGPTPTLTSVPTFTLTVPVTATFTPEDTATTTNTVVIPTNTVIIPTETLASTPTNTSVVDPTPTVVDPTATSLPTGTPVIVITETGQATATLVLTVPATVTPGSGYSCDEVIKLWKKTGDPRWRQWLDKRPWCERHPTKTPNSPTSGVGDSYSGFSPMTTLWLGSISSLFGLLLVALGGKRKIQY